MKFDKGTLKLVGVLNRLSEQYRDHGIAPYSVVKKNPHIAYVGLLYDDTKEEIDGSWHTYPLINGMDGKTYDDLFNGISFKVRWSEYENDGAPRSEPFVCAEDGEDVYYIEKSGWYY